ncbi:Uu.00g145980.m01.CDS01 [Anthostomella pinea]|uniref:Uu.00g145980.m01.CDS01 n=1 Tax=Anthostomella pinea TaxID=933095 RepID=A0AAI8YLW1_9PEZI|nr:Uu.00g145980.m01.CDS01 [Anthostomella pinea]
MASTRHHVFLFGDQTDDVTSAVHSLYAISRRSGLLTKFLREASDVCQIEFGKLEPCFRSETPPFESLLELSEQHAKTDGSPVLVASTLSYFSRLGELIVRAEEDHTLLTSDRSIIGLCISLFPAALAGTAQSASELAKLSVEAFPTYFALVVSNHYRTKRIEWAHGHWSYLVMKPSDMDLQPLLDRFHEAQDVPAHRHTWIGVVGRTWVTVSGPPSTLKQLIAFSAELRALPGMDLPVAGAVHAPHLPPLEVDILAKKSDIWNLPIQPNACVMSTDTCERYPMKTLGEILRQIVPDCTQARLKVDATITATAERIKKAGVSAAVSILGPSAQGGALIKGLKMAKIDTKVLQRPNYKLDAPHRAGSGAIAIVGMAGRFPQANDLEQFWKLIMEGRATHETVPANRFSIADFYDPTGKKKNSTITSDGCFMSDPGNFDSRLFNMSPREAMQVDPVHRCFLMACLEALEKSGYNPDGNLAAESKRTAVYFGQIADAWREINMQQGVDVFTAPGLLRAFSPGRVNYHFGFEGGSYSLDAACSSSSTSIQLACAALMNRDCDMALAGGAQISSNPYEFAALATSGFLARSGGCKTFRADADGYCRGEGVGAVVLKRLEDALADNDNIEGLITGWGRNYSAGASSITHPHPESQEKLLRQVLRQANAKPSDIGYVELHGTGTIAGDMSEMTLTTRIFNGHFKPEKPLHVGALKANIGHSEAAAGVSSVIKAVLITKRGVIPPQANINSETKFHPGFANLDMSTIKIDMEPATLDKTKNKIMVNNFDAAGGNTCLLIEGAPAPGEKSVDPRSWHTVAVSAQTNPSLKGNKQRLLDYLIRHPETKLADVAYSTTARRMHYTRKSQYMATSTEDLISQLQKDVAKAKQDIKAVNSSPDNVFMFTGQGSHYSGMAHELYSTSPQFRANMVSLQKHCLSLGLPEWIDIFTNPSEDLAAFSATQMQLAIVCLELALAELWQSWGIKPSMVMGHSLGEYVALCVAGVLSVSDTLWLVGKRATMLEANCKKDEYGMLSMSATASEVETMLKEGGFEKDCEHACYNSPKSNVVSGPVARLSELEKYVSKKGMRAKLLQIPYAFHSAQLDDIYEDFKKAAGSVAYLPPLVPVASTVTGEIVDKEGVFNANYLARHARQPVRFADALQSIQKSRGKGQAPLWLEVGPSPICSTLLRETLDVNASELLTSMKSGENNWKTIATSMGRAYVAGSSLHWPEFHRHHTDSLRLLDLPTYSFDLKSYWRAFTTATGAYSGIFVGDGPPAELLAAAEPETQSKFVPTAMVQKLQDETVEPDRVEVTFTTSVADERVRGVIRGHNIEETCICPASAYVDMAQTAAQYVHKLALPDKKSLGTLVDLELINPLVLKGEEITQLVEIKAIAEKKDDWTVSVSFRSNTEGGKFDDNGKCKVLAADPAEKKPEWAENAELVKKRIHALMNPDADSEVQHLRHRILYKLFDNLVKYGKRYQGITEAYVDYDMHDAVAKIKLVPTPDSDKGAFVIDPYHSDTLVHLAGFLLNSDHDDSDGLLSFSSGLNGMMMAAKMEQGKEYLSYVRMLTNAKGESIGDIYIFDGEEVAGVIAGLKFHQMRRAVMKLTLGLHTGAGVPQPAVVEAAPLANGAPNKAVAAPAAAASKGSMADAFIAALISETGVDPDDMEDSTELSELGVDSLMGVAILQKVQRDTGETLPATIFFELQTVGDVRAHLGGDGADGGNSSSEENSRDDLVTPTYATSVSSQTDEDGEAKRVDPADLTKKFTSNVALLQGDVKSKQRPLFFVAGSSGTASIYTQLPKLGSGTPVYVLETPFLECPHEMRYTPEEIAPVYVAAMKAAQPAGPYLLGGYSAGAVHAYEMARLLLNGGEEVEKLILADMKAHRPHETWTEAPRPEDLEGGGPGGAGGAASMAAMAAVDKNFKAMRSWELARANRFASLQCMYAWRPTPMVPSRRPTKGTVMVWARWGMCERFKVPGMEADPVVNPMAAESRDYKNWFYSRRHTYNANGWDVLVGDVETHVVDGDHWNMLEPPYAADLTKKINEAIVSL